MTFTILYDSRAVRAGLRTGWGFACLVTSTRGTLLFDAGRNGPSLLQNMKALGRDPARVTRVVISHAHSDHTGGLASVVSKAPGAAVFVPLGTRRSLTRSIVAAGGKVRVVAKHTPLDEVFTVTGPLGGSIPEQALVVRTAQGPVLVTGCGHPGIERMLDKVKAVTGHRRIYGLIGGLHLRRAGTARIRRVVRAIRDHGITLLAAGHCTGAAALAAFARAFPRNVQPAAAGTVIEIPPRTDAPRGPGRR